MIKLSKRLLTVASFIKDNSYVCDVGCDHAYLPIYLCENKKNIKVIASDINLNPLKIAKDNIKKYNLEKVIKVEQRDGINNLDKFVDTVVISGMGGILISDIIGNKDNLINVKTLILSPNNEWKKVRRTLNKIKYHIIREEIVIENKKLYIIMEATKSSKKNNIMFGKLKKNDLNVIYYYSDLLTKNTYILKKIPKKYIIKRAKLKIENWKIKKYLNSK